MKSAPQNKLHQLLRLLNHKRLGYRSAAKVRKQSLAGVRTLSFQGLSPSLQAAMQIHVDVLNALGLQATFSAGAGKTARHALLIFGDDVCASQHVDSLKAKVFGIVLSSTWAEKINNPVQQHEWLNAARMVLVPSMAALRELQAMGTPAGKLFLLPDTNATNQVPGSNLFKSALDIQRFFLARCLLAHQIISFDAFYRVSEAGFYPLPESLCLGVVEYVERLDSFLAEDTGIPYFPGVRHSTGWLGCGMSYKFLCRLALRDRRHIFTICEDDVGLPDGWRATVEAIQHKALSSFNRNELDIFAGVVTVIPADTKLLANEHFLNGQWVTLNRFTGTVFNVYGVRTMTRIMQWDDTRHDHLSNTIDKYLMRDDTLRVATLVPFVFGHKEDLTSSIWNGVNGEIYAASFDVTHQRIQAMLNDGGTKKS